MKNQTKIQAVTETFSESNIFKGVKVFPVEVSIKEFGHPIAMDSVVGGAKDRAVQAFQNYDYSFGIEGGS